MTIQLVLSATDLSIQLPNLAKFIKKHSNQKLSEIYEHIAKAFGYTSYHHLISEHKIIRPFNAEKSIYDQACSIQKLINSGSNDIAKCIELLNRFESIKLISNAFICHPDVKSLKDGYGSTGFQYKDDYFFNVYDLTNMTHIIDIKSMIEGFHQYLKEQKDSKIATASFKLNFFQVPQTLEINVKNITPPISDNQSQANVVYMHNYCVTEFEKFSSCQFLLVFSSKDRRLLSYFTNFQYTLTPRLYALSAYDSNINQLISTCYKMPCHYTQSASSYSLACMNVSKTYSMLSRELPSVFTHLMYDSFYVKESNSRELSYTYAEPNILSDSLCNPLDVMSQETIKKRTKWNCMLHKQHFLFKNDPQNTNSIPFAVGGIPTLSSLDYSMLEHTKYLNEYKQSIRSDSIKMNILNQYNKPIILETFTHSVYTPDFKKQVKTGLFGASGSGKGQLESEIMISMMNKKQKGFLLSSGYTRRIAEILNVPFISLNEDLSNVNLDLFQYIHTEKYSTVHIELLTEYLTCVLCEDTYLPSTILHLLQSNVYASMSEFLSHCSLTLKPEFNELMIVKDTLDLNNNLIIFDLEAMYLMQDFLNSVAGTLLSLMSLFVDRYVIVDIFHHFSANYAISKNWYCLYSAYDFRDLPHHVLSTLDNVILLQCKLQNIEMILRDTTHTFNRLFNKYAEKIKAVRVKQSMGGFFLLLNVTPNAYDSFNQYDISEECVQLFFPTTDFIQTLTSYKYHKFNIPTIHQLLNDKPLSFTRAKELFNALKE